MSIRKNISNLSPYDIELLRNKFAENNQYKKFKELYKKGVPEIKNRNTNNLWSKKFTKIETINEKDMMTKEKISYIASFLKSQNEKFKLLDIGIGQAYLEQELTNRGIKLQLSAVDISELSIERVKKKYKGEAHTADALTIKKLFKPKSFDVIVAIEVIEHIPPHQIFSLYKQAYQLLKPGGLFIISTPTNENLSEMKTNPNAHVREYTIPILKTEFELNRFEILNIKTHVAFQTLYRFKKILMHIFPNRWKPNNIIVIAKKV